MPDRPWPLGLALAFGSVAALGCGLMDLLQSPGLDEVTFTFVGPTTLRVGDSLPFAVTVRAGDAELPSPRLRMALAHSSAVRLTAGRDSLVAVAVGKDTLHVWLVNSIVTGAEPSFAQEIKVQGSPPPAPPRAGP